MKIDWDKVVGGVNEQPAQKSIETERVSWDALLSSPQVEKQEQTPAPVVKKELTFDEELDELRKDVVRPFVQGGAAWMRALGQHDRADELDKTLYYLQGAAEAPVFGEAPGARFMKETAISEGTKLGTRVAVAMIPFVGLPLVAADLAMQTYGEARGEILKETGEDQPGAALVPAALNLGLEALPVVRILEKAGVDNIFIKQAKDYIASDKALARATKFTGEVAGTAALEGFTEVAQTAITKATIRVLKNEDLLGKLSPEDQNELWANFWGGLSGGGAAQTVVSGYTQMTTSQRLKDVERAIETDNDILNMIEAEEAPTVREFTQADAAAMMIERARNTPAGSPTAKPTAPVEETADLQQPPQSELDTILYNDKVEIAEEVRQLPEEQRAIAIASLKEQIAKAEQEKQILLDLTSDEDASGFQPEEGNYGIMQGFKRNELNISDVFSVTGKMYTIIDDQLVTSSIPKLPSGDIDMTDGVMVYADQDSKPNLDDVRMVNEIKELAEETNLMNNPETGEPMRLIVRFRKDPKTDAFLSVVDKNTYFLNITPGLEKTDLADTLVHELGHALVAHTMASLNEKQLSRLHSMWVKDLGTYLTRDKYYKATGSSYAGEFNAAKEIRDTDKQGKGDTYYKTSMQEYLADMFRRSLYSRVERDMFKQLDGTKTSTTYPALYKGFRQLQRTLRAGRWDSPTVADARFDQFVEYAALDRRIREDKAKLEQMERDDKAAKANKDVLPTTDEKEASNIYVTQGNVYTSAIDPESELADLTRFIQKIGREKDAKNVAEIAEINLGFLGDNLRGAAARKILTPLQIAEQAGNKGFSLPTQYMELVQEFQVTKMRVIEKADTLLREWSKDTQAANRVGRLLYLISTRSDEVKFRLTEEMIDKIAKQVKATPEDVAMWRKIDGFMLEIVDQLESAMVYEAAKTYLNDSAKAREFRDQYMDATNTQREALIEEYTEQPLINLGTEAQSLTNPLWDALNGVEKQVAAMRNRNYYPRSRLGEYAVRVTATEKEVEWEGTTAKKAGETVGFYAFDTKEEQTAFLKEIASEMGAGLKAVGYKMSSEVFAMMGMPVGLIDQIKRDIPSLTPDQLRQINDISLQKSPGRKFLKHLTKRRGVAGYSEDAMRVFANYATSSANHMAKAEWSADLGSVLNQMERAVTDTEADVALNNDIRQITDYFKRHFNYMFKPDNDWARLRAIGFVYYLGFNVKSAFVNFMQTPMVLYPALAAHTSDKRAMSRIAGAMKDAVKVMKGTTALAKDETDMLQRMIEAGLIDESMVSELAGMAEADALKRMIPGMDLKGRFDKFAHAAGGLFRIGEKYNRYVAALAGYRIAKDNGLDFEAAVKFTRDIIQGSQFEYSRWNRAEFMRGKKSVLFLFWQYMQHASYLAFGGKGAATARRMWLLAFLVAGLEGLPFAEFALDIIDFSGTQLRKLFGHANPRVAMRDELREIITEFTDKPDIILKGMSYQYGLGPLHAASFLGLPVPNVSTRGSLSYGDPIPWFDGLTDPTISDSQAMLAKTVAAVAGPVGGIGLGIFDALNSKSEDNWKTWEKVLPMFARNASTGIRWMANGEETDYANAKLLSFTTPEQRAEAVVKSLGFQPTRVDQTRQQIRAVQMHIVYQQIRRESLLRQLDYAYSTNNREAIADVMSEIQDYNKSLLGKPGMATYMIKGTSIQRSLRERAKTRAEREVGIRQGREGYILEQEMKKLYPVTAGETDGNN